MNSPARHLKGALAWAFRLSPLPFLIRAYRRHKATILVYHNPEPQIFEQHLRYLAARFNFISLSDLVSAVQLQDWSRMPPNPLVVTLDDGHLNNHKLCPLFAKWRVKPTIFLCSHIVNTRRGYWWRSGLRDVGEFKRLPYSQFLRNLWTQAQFTLTAEVAERQALNLTEMQKLAPHVEFGSHTKFHPILPNCPEDICRDEMTESKRALQRLLGHPVGLFAFPNGDYGARELQLLQEAGYAAARSLDFGWNDEHSDLCRLKAIEIDDKASRSLLSARVHGFFPWLRHLTEKVKRKPSRRLTEAIMLGPYPLKSGQGGISSVVAGYADAGILTKYRIKYISTSSTSNHVVKAIVLAVAFLRFMALASQNSVRLVHIHSASWRSFKRKAIFVHLAKLLNNRVLLHLHGGEFQKFYEGASSRQRSRISLTLQRADLVCAVSRSLQTQVKQATPRARTLVLPNPVHLAKYALPCTASKPETPTVVFIGRLTEEKGAFDLIEAAADVAKRIPTVKFRLCGLGQAAACIRIREHSRLSAVVEFPGWVNEAQKLNELGRAWVFVLPSHSEGLPVAVLEAMAAGLPIVATRVGGVPELVENGRNGLLVAPCDTGQLAAALTRLLTQAELRLRMGRENQRKIAQHYDVGVIGAALAELYLDLRGYQKSVALSENNSTLVEFDA